jgi:hypothetical protein
LVYVSRNNKDSGAYDLGELDQALFLYLNGQNDPTSVHEQKRKLFFNHMKIMRKKSFFFLLNPIPITFCFKLKKGSFFFFLLSLLVCYGESFLGHTKTMFIRIISAAEYYSFDHILSAEK